MAQWCRCRPRGRRAIAVHPERRRKRLALGRFGGARGATTRRSPHRRRGPQNPPRRGGAAISSGELAAAARLSESRFLHLFRDELGTSLRRYRLWVRLIHAGTAIAAGDNLTTAAMKAGFASPSHLADRFKTTFGLSATKLLGTGLALRTP